MFSFAHPAFLWLLTLAIPFILLHFLRQRREERVVAGVFLWRRAQERTATRRRLISTILLILQLLLLLLATLLLSGLRIGEDAVVRRVIVVDASVSMLADAPGGSPASRVTSAIADLASGATEHLVVRAGLVPRVTPDIEFGDATADLAAAARIGLAALPGAELHVITDQSFTLQSAEALANHGVFVHNVLGGALRENVGITAIELSDNVLFAVVTNNSPRPREVPLTLRTGRAAHHTTLLVPGGGSSGVSIPHGGDVGEFQLHITESDALAHDNAVFVLNEPAVVVTNDDSSVFSRLFAALPNVTSLFSPNPERLAADLVFVARDVPLPGAVSSTVRFPQAGEPGEQVLIGSYAREHPLLRFVDLTNVSVHVPSGMMLSAEGWDVIASSRSGDPLIQVRLDETGWHVEFAFHPAESDFPLRTAFPAFFYNLLNAVSRSTLAPLGSDNVFEPGVHRGRAYNVLAATETLLPTELDDLTQRELMQAVRAQSGAETPVSDAARWPLILLLFIALLLLAEWLLAVQAWPRWRLGRVEG